MSEWTGTGATTGAGSGVHLSTQRWWHVCSVGTVDAVDAALRLWSNKVIVTRFWCQL